MWKQFYEYWINIAEEGTIPVHFFRFEDLSTNPEKVLREIFEFSLGVESIKDTYIEKRIRSSITNK